MPGGRDWSLFSGGGGQWIRPVETEIAGRGRSLRRAPRSAVLNKPDLFRNRAKATYGRGFNGSLQHRLQISLLVSGIARSF
jgi:hypothetical protein